MSAIQTRERSSGIAGRKLARADGPPRMVILLRKDNLFHEQCPTDYIRDQAQRHAVDLTIATSPADLRDALKSADIFVSNEIPPGSIAAAPRLVWIHALAAGVENVMVPEVRASTILVTNSAGTMAPEVAEHALALILALTRRIDHCVRAQTRRHWAPIRRDFPPVGLSGLNLGIVGYGHIGRALAERTRAFGVKLVALRRHAAPADGVVDRILGRDQMAELLNLADIVVVALPLVDETRGLFGTEQFRAMKRSAVFVNVGRGAVVDEAALFHALQHQSIAGAACDVFAAEPLPPESLLWNAPNLIISPHLAGASEQVWMRVVDLIFTNVERLRRGENPINTVDKTMGY